MSTLINAASQVLSALPPRLAARIVLGLSPLLPLVSARHRERFRVAKRLYGQRRTIQFGPFAGMQYFNIASGSQLLPKLAGTYEMELQSVFGQIVELAPDLIADIGSAEGYYVVGLARRVPASRVLAYDVNPLANSLCEILARVNGVADRVEICGECSPLKLEKAICTARRPLVICDVEGCEDELLRPAETASLQKAHVLVELHDGQRPGVSHRIRERFDPTHRIDAIPEVATDPTILPAGLKLTSEEARLAVDEGRHHDQEWFWMSPRN